METMTVSFHSSNCSGELSGRPLAGLGQNHTWERADGLTGQIVCSSASVGVLTCFLSIFIYSKRTLKYSCCHSPSHAYTDRETVLSYELLYELLTFRKPKKTKKSLLFADLYTVYVNTILS